VAQSEMSRAALRIPRTKQQGGGTESEHSRCIPGASLNHLFTNLRIAKTRALVLAIPENCVVGDAVLFIRNSSVDSAVPEETRFKAAVYRAGTFRANVTAHLESRLSGMEPGSAAKSACNCSSVGSQGAKSCPNCFNETQTVQPISNAAFRPMTSRTTSPSLIKAPSSDGLQKYLSTPSAATRSQSLGAADDVIMMTGVSVHWE
jgi:hypothetical protein